MFNHHFFDKDTGKTLLQNFIQQSTPKSIAVVMDPPFGGLVQVIATSLRKIWKFVCLNGKDKGIYIYNIYWRFLRKQNNT